MSNISEDLRMAQMIAKKVDALGGRSYFVGGYVRDEQMGIENKDIDIEIHGIERSTLTAILQELGELVETGASFGVYGIKGYDLDIALPRKEKAVGKGHKDFEVLVDPFLGSKEAAIRRDFTINALMKDVVTGEIVDHFSGMEHLKDGILHYVNAETFAEDPLRLLRGAQFAARFDFRLSNETVELCKQMDTKTLTKERVLGEMKKALLKADKPSIFFEEMKRMNQLSYWFEEVEKLDEIPQGPEHHMEGNVWVHTMMVLDRAAKCRDLVEDPLAFMLAALCHDFGKIVATEEKNGKIHAYGHEVKGLPLVKHFLGKLTSEKQMTDYILNMVRYHMKPHMLSGARSAIKKTNLMFDESVDPWALILLSECDARSSISGDGKPYNEEDKTFLVERYELYKEYMARPYVTGKDLIEAGLKPDKNFSDILAYAHKLRLAGVEKEVALRQAMAYARKGKK
ncbi:MAG: HD domain-containing protein [Eubacteriales bacterium]|nr:HD domain-containing protein [Eubacteriales bacterium]